MTSYPHRRRLLQIGAAGLMSLGRLETAVAAASRSRAKSVIFLHQFGGPSQLETFDPKPDAPIEIRGKLGVTKTNLPGTIFCEKLPRLAKMADKMTIIRCLQHEMKNHNSAAYYSLTGASPAVDDQRLRDSLDLYPAFGSVVDRFRPSPKGIPTFVAYPYVISDGSVSPGQHASFLGKVHDPLFIGRDPNAADFKLPELTLPDDLTPERLENRREVLNLIDEQTRLLETSSPARGIDDSYKRALAMLTSPQVRQAFDLSSEKDAVRKRYGRNTYGQSCLLARRLIEVGVRFVNVYFSPSIGGAEGGWDVHSFDGKPMYPILENHLLPKTDESVSALLEDLEERGLMDECVVLWMGEFGRTPKINGNQGRDHWPRCYSIMMAGAGIKCGAVVGGSDKWSSFPIGEVYRPEDVAATIYDLLGIPPETEVRDKMNRPLPIARGKPITAALA